MKEAENVSGTIFRGRWISRDGWTHLEHAFITLDQSLWPFILNVQMFRTVTGLKGIVGSVANVRCLCVILCIMTKLLNVTPETHETFLLTCCDRAWFRVFCHKCVSFLTRMSAFCKWIVLYCTASWVTPIFVIKFWLEPADSCRFCSRRQYLKVSTVKKSAHQHS